MYNMENVYFGNFSFSIFSWSWVTDSEENKPVDKGGTAVYVNYVNTGLEEQGCEGLIDWFDKYLSNDYLDPGTARDAWDADSKN